MRQGLLLEEVGRMKQQIASGMTWDEISKRLAPEDDRQYVKTKFYEPMKAAFDKLPKPPPPAPTTQACAACKAVNPIAKKFCGDCGASLVKAADSDGLPPPAETTTPAKPLLTSKLK